MPSSFFKDEKSDRWGIKKNVKKADIKNNDEGPKKDQHANNTVGGI